MAGPTVTRTETPDLFITSAGTNIDAGNNDIVLSNRSNLLVNGFSIATGTLTAMTVTILATVGSKTVDITGDLFPSVSALASNSLYIIAIPLNVQTITIRAARTNATNALDLTIFRRNR